MAAWCRTAIASSGFACNNCAIASKCSNTAWRSSGWPFFCAAARLAALYFCTMLVKSASWLFSFSGSASSASHHWRSAGQLAARNLLPFNQLLSKASSSSGSTSSVSIGGNCLHSAVSCCCHWLSGAAACCGLSGPGNGSPPALNCISSASACSQGCTSVSSASGDCATRPSSCNTAASVSGYKKRRQ